MIRGALQMGEYLPWFELKDDVPILPLIRELHYPQLTRF